MANEPLTAKEPEELSKALDKFERMLLALQCLGNPSPLLPSTPKWKQCPHCRALSLVARFREEFTIECPNLAARSFAVGTNERSTGVST